MEEVSKKYRLTIYLDMPGGSNIVTWVDDPQQTKSTIQKLVDDYFNCLWFFRWRSSWVYISGSPYICFPIERMVMFTISQEPEVEVQVVNHE